MAAIDALQNSIDAIPRRSTSPEGLHRDLIDNYTRNQKHILDALHNLQTTIAPAMELIKTGEPMQGIEKGMQTDTSSDVPPARSPARRPESESGIEAKRRRMDSCALQETPGGNSPTPQTPPLEENADDMEEFFRKNADFMEVVDEVNEGSVEESRSPDSPEPLRARVESPIRQSEEQHLLKQLRQAEQARDDLASMICDLEAKPTYHARYYHEGEKLRNIERSLQCVFCLAIGRHYSDSCIEMRYAKERRDHLKRTNRCIMCLKIRCRGGRDCSKYDTRCFHCDKYGHHSAVCELPDASERIRDRLSTLRNAYADAVKKTVHLNLRLERKNAL
ncbi:hypothetical protein Y032_0008g231 [Ancylostoma ceylanicum]|uniref:CCHC-type domain-containing protein n=1 Tax=Ancylostoma ceylanicum TaxID=53326 RepID=A0A016VKQ9_9BILA|nr:hypothetical protein Y032_0008g231 [Ancylostoma ceylanicum]